jgi:mannonate dehydratase
MKDNRRDFIRKSASLAAAMSVTGISACSGPVKENNESAAGKIVKWPVTEGPDTPKICLGTAIDISEKQMRMIKQIGVDHVFVNGPAIPWTTEGLGAIMDRFKSEGLTIINMMVTGYPNTIYGREGRDAEIEKVKESLIAAGKVGLPVVEYNFYADRLVEGYYEKKGRGGSGITAFDYAPVKDLPAKPELGSYTSEQLWENLTYFLKAVIPVAEKANVRMSLHPNDPPVPISKGSAQIMATFNDWKRLINLFDSTSNGMTYDCGVSREIGEDPLEVLRYLGSRDRINHLHYRNITLQEPYVRYEEVFIDEGEVNMLAVMKEIIRLKYKFGLNPEHPRAIDYDVEHQGPGGIPQGAYYPGGGGYAGETFNVAYARAMMQAVISLE